MNSHLAFALFPALLWLVVGQDIRLAEGDGEHHGRVELRIGLEWGTVCDGSFGIEEAKVVCRQLGYTDVNQASVLDNSLFYYYYYSYWNWNYWYDNPFEGTGPIYLDELACTGDEIRLVDCTHNGVASHDCDHSNDAAVSCYSLGGTGCLDDPPCPPIEECVSGETEIVTVAGLACPICQCALCPSVTVCPEDCPSGMTEYYDGIYCQHCRCVPEECPVTEEPGFSTDSPTDLPAPAPESECDCTTLLIAIPLSMFLLFVVCLVFVIFIFKRKQPGRITQSPKPKAVAPKNTQSDNWFGPPGGEPKSSMIAVY